MPVTSRELDSPAQRSEQLSAVRQSTLHVAEQTISQPAPSSHSALELAPSSDTSQVEPVQCADELAPSSITQSLDTGHIALDESPPVQSQLPASPHWNEHDAGHTFPHASPATH
jgi:hypothetical protein